MGEKHNREKKDKLKPLKDECANCGEKYHITPDNGAVFEYTQKPECNYMATKCPHCEGVTHMFLHPTSNTINDARDREITIFSLDWPSDDIYNQWLELNGIELIKERELSERKLAHVAFLEYLIENDLLTEEEFENGTGELYI